MNSRILLLPVIATVSFLTLFAIYSKAIGPIPLSVNLVTTTKSHTFDVAGVGKVTVMPDVATINVGIRAQAQTVKAAQDQLNTNINQVTQAIKQLGLDQKDIKTTDYNIYPDYDYSAGSQKIKGYSANTNISVKTKDLDKINQVIDAATANGANQVSGISFDVDDKEKAENQAREKAVSDAKSKAVAAAEIAGFKLGRIINYSEDLGRGQILPRGTLGAAEVQKTQVEPGTNTIIVTVTLSYEIF